MRIYIYLYRDVRIKPQSDDTNAGIYQLEVMYLPAYRPTDQTIVGVNEPNIDLIIIYHH